jgi:hypothetical protein
MSGRQPVVKIIAESLSHDEKHVVPTPLSGIRVGGRISETMTNLDIVSLRSDVNLSKPSRSAG